MKKKQSNQKARERVSGATLSLELEHVRPLTENQLAHVIGGHEEDPDLGTTSRICGTLTN